MTIKRKKLNYIKQIFQSNFGCSGHVEIVFWIRLEEIRLSSLLFWFMYVPILFEFENILTVVFYIYHFHTLWIIVLCNNWSFYFIYLRFPQKIKNGFTYIPNCLLRLIRKGNTKLINFGINRLWLTVMLSKGVKISLFHCSISAIIFGIWSLKSIPVISLRLIENWMPNTLNVVKPQSNHNFF